MRWDPQDPFKKIYLAQISSQALASTKNTTTRAKFDSQYAMAEPQNKGSQSPELLVVSCDRRGKCSSETTSPIDFPPKLCQRPVLDSAAEGKAGQKQKQNQKQEIHRQISWNDFPTRNRVILAEGWKKLTDEERAKLEIDIFKPLDFYEILFNRMRANNSGKIITSLDELDM